MKVNDENNNSSLSDKKKIKKLENQINNEIKNLFTEMNLSYKEEYKFKINDINNINEEYQIFVNRILKKYFNNVSIDENKIKSNYNNEIEKSSEISHKNNKNRVNKDDIFKHEKLFFLLFILIFILFILLF